MHITTLKPSKFFHELQRLLISDYEYSVCPLAEYDPDTGQPIERLDAALLSQALSYAESRQQHDEPSLVLPPCLRLEANAWYPSVARQEMHQTLPSKGYYWTIIPHPSTKQSTIRRVFTRDPASHTLYLQHYLVVTKTFDEYQLKNTQRNKSSKGLLKYTNTTSTSAIIKCQGCQLHDSTHLMEAQQRSSRNFRSPPTCIFKQSIEDGKLLSVKTHQIYQDIILLKHHLRDILTPLTRNTNLAPIQAQPNQDDEQRSQPREIDRPIDSHFSHSYNLESADQLIEQFIDAPELISALKQIAQVLRPYKEVQFYTDGSLHRDSSNIDTMGLGWINVNQENVYFSASAILWPSSTKAEMLACLSALIVAAPKAHVTLFTDSAATIAGFDHLNDFMQKSVQKKEKTPNFQIWMTIAYIIR